MKKILLILTLLPVFAMANLQKERSERIERVYNNLRADKLEILDDFYHPRVKFEDPVGKLEGLEAIKSYYKEMYKNVKEIRFEFTNEVIAENQHVVFWDMYLKAKALNSGKEVVVGGNSLIIFDEKTNKVNYHRDYFDMGEFVYEYIPILGRIIKKVKSMFEHQQ